MAAKKRWRCKNCGRAVCHWPCDFSNTKASERSRKTCPCRYCTLNRKLGVA